MSLHLISYTFYLSILPFTKCILKKQLNYNFSEKQRKVIPQTQTPLTVC